MDCNKKEIQIADCAIELQPQTQTETQTEIQAQDLDLLMQAIDINTSSITPTTPTAPTTIGNIQPTRAAPISSGQPVLRSTTHILKG